MARILRYFTEFGNFVGTLCKSDWSLDKPIGPTICSRHVAKECSFSDISFTEIFAEITGNEWVPRAVAYELLNITLLLTQYYFQIQLQVWFYHDW